ncbi:MAG TPA: cytochrome c peroxidase [Polyangia bacterium]|nr:cytochrome c peroxidase [Polyangia bacterium]
MKPASQTTGRVTVWAFVVGSLVGCASTAAPVPTDNFANLMMVAEAISPPQDPNRVALGRFLFHDPRLSKNREVSCSTCHVLSKFGIDGKIVSTGVGGRQGRRNSPSVFNAATHIAQFWDGRAADVESQAVVPIMNPVEMDMPNEQAVVDALAGVPRYAEMFHQAFPDDDHPISLRNVGEALGAFERGLVTTSRWDKFIAGDHKALTPRERQGLGLFVQRGCLTCHTGPQAGGMTFQKVGTIFPWPNQKDQGRAEITHYPPDRMVFKVPSMKNIAETAPYFHDGSTTSLETAIRLMGHHQLGIEMPKDEVDAIAAWMRSMTGVPDPAYIAVPRLPPG